MANSSTRTAQFPVLITRIVEAVEDSSFRAEANFSPRPGSKWVDASINKNVINESIKSRESRCNRDSDINASFSQNYSLVCFSSGMFGVICIRSEEETPVNSFTYTYITNA